MPVGMTDRREKAQQVTVAPLLQQAVELERLLTRLPRQLGRLSVDHAMPDITVHQLRVCLLLEDGPMTLSTIGRELDICRSAATQIADRLEKAEMVERISTLTLSTLTDRRNRYLQLTENGKERMLSWRTQRVERAELILARLSYESRQQALRVLNMLLDAACEMGQPVAES